MGSVQFLLGVFNWHLSTYLLLDAALCWVWLFLHIPLLLKC